MTAVSELDDKTAAAIRQALTAASFGRISDACLIGERALQAGGDAAALHAMLGMLRIRSSDFDTAVVHLTAAHEQRPRDVLIANNLATALAKLGRNREALEIISDELVDADPSLQLLRLRGFVAQSRGEFALAVEAYERVVAAVPDDWESWNNLGNARRALDDHEGSLEAARRSIELNPKSAAVRLNYATALEYAGRPEEAEGEYRAIAVDFPDDPNSVRELFALLKNQYRDDEALAAIQEAIKRAPKDEELALAFAGHLLTQRRHGAAEESYRRVLRIAPGNGPAWLGIATVLDQTNRLEELATLVGLAEQANIDAASLNFIKAFDHRRAKRYAEGLEALSDIPDDLETGRRQQLLGQLLEGAGRYDEAFAAFERMNAIIRNDRSEPEARAELHREQVRAERDALSPEWASSWEAVKIDDRPSPVFLVGFPRSGTTLLDTILMSHPSTEVLEEEPTLLRATEVLGGFKAIPHASSEQIKAARDAYFETARSLTPLACGKLLVDKNPLAMNAVPMIRRLFPDAKIIVALRHPCDVVFSCFMTNFNPNNAMASFLRLDTSAELYDLSFSYLEKSKEILKPDTHTIVYENIVADRDRELRPLFDFLGLEWDERVLDHQSTAKRRGHIKTASYAQVVEPIYTRSAGRWQHYRKYLEPIIPVLEPWVAKFGYAM